jgi:hypothetical protein
MRPNWYGICGWTLLLVAAVLALTVVPYPLNGLALVAVAVAVAGGVLIALAVERGPGR